MPVASVRVTNAPLTAPPDVVCAVPDKLELHILALIAPTLTSAVTGVKGVTVEFAVADPVASTCVTEASSCDAWNTGPVGQAIAVGRRQSSGLPPMAVVRALMSPYSVRPVNVTVKVGAWPDSATERFERSTVFGAVDGIATFVQPVIAEPSAVFTVNVADE